MRLIDADAYSAEMKDRQEAAWKWRNEAIAEEDEVKLARAEGFAHERNICEKHPELGNVPDDWFCADGEREVQE